MVTDDERHEAANWLRKAKVYTIVGKRNDGLTLEWNVALMSELAEAVGLEDADGIEVFDRLADLIDPDCEEGRYEGVHTARPVDRDALLVLADGLCDGYPYGLSHGGLEQLARHIREACGERNRERGRYE